MTILSTQKFWNIKRKNSKQQLLLTEAGVDPVVAQLLINRGIRSVQEVISFLTSGLDKLHDPFLLKDMRLAVERIKQAKNNKETVLIFGDYDVDGVTSSAILYQVLTRWGIRALNHIPHRMDDGYGLNDNIGQFAKQEGVGLIIAVDCGITSNKEVDAFNKLGIDIIIFDHHEPSEEGIPKALAVVDPKRKDCPYPFKKLAAVGLVAKLVQAIWPKDLKDYLDLIALGTIADVVPLYDENRIFVREGLPEITKTKNLGLSTLLQVAKIHGKKFQPFYAGFVIGPRLNAGGRMESAHRSLNLLLSKDKQEALTLAKSLDRLNSERQRLQRNIIQEALSLVEQQINFNEEKVIIVSQEGWHKGVLGIVASRIAETYYRPAIVVSLEDGVGRASARSIEGFHLYDALAHCSNLLDEYGGHKLAAGLTIQEKNINAFRKKINHFAKDLLEFRDLIPTITIDCEVPLSSLSLELMEKIEQLEPFGEGNPEPLFCSRQVMVKSHPLVLGKNTLKFWVTDGGRTFSCVGFGMGDYKALLQKGQKIDIAYQLIIDDWNKAPVVQLKLKDIKLGT